MLIPPKWSKASINKVLNPGLFILNLFSKKEKSCKIAFCFPDDPEEKTIKQQFDIEPPDATTTLDNPQINQMTMVDNWDKVLASDIVPDEVVNLWKEIKEDNSLFVEMVMLSNKGYTQSAIAARQKIQIKSVRNNLAKMRDKYNKDGKEIVLLAVTRRKLGIKQIKEDTGAIEH